MNSHFLTRVSHHLAYHLSITPKLFKLAWLLGFLVSLGQANTAYAADQCNWYGNNYTVCTTTQSGWGWENNASCVARSDCSAQPKPYGVIVASSSSSSTSTTYPNCANAASDPDGDGWGWENNKSCIVVKSSSSKSSSSSSSTSPNCASAASDPDGDGWGWENNKSCIVVKTSTQCNVYGVTYPVCTSTQSGWGWENNASCIARTDCIALPSPYGLIGGSSSSSAATGGLHVNGKNIVDGDGKQVVLRGPELVHRWGVYSGLTSLGVDVAWEGGKNNNVASSTIREIGKTGANAMRLLGGIGNELDELLRTAIVEQKMYVAVARVDWTNAQMKATLQKYAKYIILHPRGEFTHRDPALWRTEALKVVKEIRALGYTSPIEIGTTGYGQTWPTIAQYGAEVAASDPLKNTLFLLQLYSEYANKIPATLNEIANFPYPVIVDACLFTSTYGNTANTYKEVWDQSWQKNMSSFYWDWWGDGEGNSMTTNGYYSSWTSVGRYIALDSPGALKYSAKTSFLLNATVP